MSHRTTGTSFIFDDYTFEDYGSRKSTLFDYWIGSGWLYRRYLCRTCEYETGIVPGNSTALLWPALSVHLDSLYFATAILKQGNFSDTVRLDSKEKLKSAFQTVYYDFKSQTK